VRTAEGLARRETEARRLATACGHRSGSLIAHVDTVSAARDLDVVRAVLGEGRLNYLGLSYGTLLGARYADLFPVRVGRFVLDAGLDPSMDETARRLDLAAGLESALRPYVEYCLAVAPCPLSGSVDDGVHEVRALLDRLVAAPLPTATTRALTAPLAAVAVMVGVSEERTWPTLSSGLEAAWSGRGGPLLDLADGAAGRDPEGRYLGNAFAASLAVTCLDFPRRPVAAELPMSITGLGRVSPTFGRFLADPLILCSVWPVEPAGVSTPVRALGAAPVLVIGTTHDPAAPYAWSLALAGQLQSARLLTYDGIGHTTIGRPVTCVENAVTAYLLRGELPPEGTVCRARAG
jgi:pimeloyl-ACP methyl ester carboxylesterase